MAASQESSAGAENVFSCFLPVNPNPRHWQAAPDRLAGRLWAEPGCRAR